MATGTKSDFQIYHEQYYGGMHEALDRMVDAFNAASQFGIILQPKTLIGDYEQVSYFDRPTNLITRRDITSVSTANDIKMTMDEQISVKLNRKIGPMGQTIDAWRKIGKTTEEMSLKIGQMVAEDKMKDMLDYALYAAEAALSGQSNNTYDYSATGTITSSVLSDGLNKLGDKRNEVVCWIMHSKVYNDLIKAAISAKIYGEAGVVVYGAEPGTLGKPTVVTDSAALNLGAESTSSTYQTIGLVRAGIVVTESEEEVIVTDTVTDKENLIYRIHGEFAYNVGLKGFKWDTSSGGANPNLSTLKTATNWDKVYSSHKNLCGVRIVTT